MRPRISTSDLLHVFSGLEGMRYNREDSMMLVKTRSVLRITWCYPKDLALQEDDKDGEAQRQTTAVREAIRHRS